MMAFIVICALLAQSIGFAFNTGNRFLFAAKWKRNYDPIKVLPIEPFAKFRSFNLMASSDDSSNVEGVADVVEVTSEVTSEVPSVATDGVEAIPSNDFSQFQIGQKYDAKVLIAKPFGIFVDISKGKDVLLMKSSLSKTSYDRLKELADSKSSDTIQIELTGVSVQNQTLSGKYLAPPKTFGEFSSLEGEDLKGKLLNATVRSTHDFGLFATLDDYGIDGLVPASLLPDPLPSDKIQTSYKSGQKVEVMISRINFDDKKLLLNMNLKSRDEFSAFENVPKDKWQQGTIQGVKSFGLFVRPVGTDVSGLLPNRVIPRELVTALLKRLPEDADKSVNKTDVEKVFSTGDVIRFRFTSVSADQRKMELSMMEFRADDDDEDDYVVEGRDPEGEEFDKDEDEDDDEIEQFDVHSTLLWWRGAPYVKAVNEDEIEIVDEEENVLNESNQIVEGTWRRLFEIDLRETEADVSSKIMEEEAKELAEEIGELSGLDDEMVDSIGVGIPHKINRMGSYISMSALPAEWREQMDFYKELSNFETAKMTKLKSGKKGEQAEFEALMRELEAEADRAPRSRRSVEAAPAFDDIPAVAIEPTIAVAVESEVPVDVE